MNNPTADHRLLRAAAPIAVPAGALGSVGLTLLVGHRNDSRVLLALFALWVLSPFVALAWTHGAATRWSAGMLATLDRVTLLIALGSVLVYANVAFGPPMARPAFPFLVVPLVSWLPIALVAAIGALKRKPHEDPHR